MKTRNHTSQNLEDDNSDSDVPFPSDSEPPSVIRTPSLRSNASAGPSREVHLQKSDAEYEPEAESESESEPIHAAYLAALQAHIDATRARYTPSSSTTTSSFNANVKGKGKAEEFEELEGDESISRTRWTEAEKDVFFYSLARHSRLRPDLIAQDMQTAFPLSSKPKSLPEITSYLTSLAHTSHTTESPTQHKRKWADLDGRKHTHQKRRRIEMGCAVEVGEETVAREERMAKGVRGWVEQGGEGEVRSRMGRRRAEEREWVKREGGGGEEGWKEEMERRWEREDWESSVGKSGWVVLDRMLKEAEDEEAGGDGLEGEGEGENVRIEKMDERTDHERIETLQSIEPRRIDDALIDPALLALDPNPPHPPPPPPVHLATPPPHPPSLLPPIHLHAPSSPIPLPVPSETSRTADTESCILYGCSEKLHLVVVKCKSILPS